MGIDLGAKRIGVAVSDASGTIASPLRVIARTKDAEAAWRAVAQIVAEYDAERVVVGLPLSLDGSRGPAAEKAEDDIEALRSIVRVPVDTVDERLTTVTAHEALAAQGLREKERRAQVDKVAAAVLLQAWLDQQERP